jgi:DNA-binding GntR family transcriptional regulator
MISLKNKMNIASYPYRGKMLTSQEISAKMVWMAILTPLPASANPKSSPPNYGHGSLSEKAYLMVRDRILRGQLPLGTALSRRKLAEEFHMSLLPVSEALQRLENDGLVESRPRVGTRVRIPTPQDIRECHVVREALESQSARLFAEKASSQERRELLGMAEQTDVLFNRCGSGETDPEFLFAVHNFHFQLHMRIAECTGCRALRETIEKQHVLVFNWLYDMAARCPPLPPRFHRDLLEVLTGADPEAADAVMRRHIRYGLDNILQGIQSNVSDSRWSRL